MRRVRTVGFGVVLTAGIVVSGTGVAAAQEPLQTGSATSVIWGLTTLMQLLFSILGG